MKIPIDTRTFVASNASVVGSSLRQAHLPVRGSRMLSFLSRRSPKSCAPPRSARLTWNVITATGFFPMNPPDPTVGGGFTGVYRAGRVEFDLKW